MVDSKGTNKKSLKDLLKNKRTIKGTPLHRYASRYAAYFALSLGCAHVTIGCIVYYIDVDDFWLKSGPEYISHKVVEVGLYDTHMNDTNMKIEEIKEDFQKTGLYALYSLVSDYVNDFKKRMFSSSSVDAANMPSETAKGASTPISSSLNSSAIKDVSQ